MGCTFFRPRNGVTDVGEDVCHHHCCRCCHNNKSPFATDLPSPTSLILPPIQLNHRRSSMLNVPPTIRRRYDGMRRDQTL